MHAVICTLLIEIFKFSFSCESLNAVLSEELCDRRILLMIL